MLVRVLALLYDIHGNLPALEAVIEDAEAAGTTQYLLGGDYCLLGPQPAEVLHRLHALPAGTIWLRGNADRWVAEPDSADIPLPPLRDACHIAAGAIGRPSVSELMALPQMLAELPVPGAEGVIFCHASPHSDMIGFIDQPLETDGAAADSGLEANTIVCGHTHIQFHREVGVIEVINPGSVGLPFDGDHRAAYAILNPDGSFNPRRVEYDVERTITSYGDRDAEWVEIGKRRLRDARP